MPPRKIHYIFLKLFQFFLFNKVELRLELNRYVWYAWIEKKISDVFLEGKEKSIAENITWVHSSAIFVNCLTQCRR